MVDKSEFAIATSEIQIPFLFLLIIELFFKLLSQIVTVSTIKLTSQPVRVHSYENRCNLCVANGITLFDTGDSYETGRLR